MYGISETPLPLSSNRTVEIALWLALWLGWLVSVFSVIQEMCLASACSDAAVFTIFGFNMGWFGIAYFTLLLIVQWFKKRINHLDLLRDMMVFAGIGAELRLLWIQKFVIGGWCPLCVTICCALFVAAILLLIGKPKGTHTVMGRNISFYSWLAVMVAMSAVGLAIAIIGVKAIG
jgi:hypothetical protein